MAPQERLQRPLPKKEVTIPLHPGEPFEQALENQIGQGTVTPAPSEYDGDALDRAHDRYEDELAGPPPALLRSMGRRRADPDYVAGIQRFAREADERRARREQDSATQASKKPQEQSRQDGSPGIAIRLPDFTGGKIISQKNKERNQARAKAQEEKKRKNKDKKKKKK